MGQRIVLVQQACEEKSNEITAIPLLLKNLDLKRVLVTIDAMGTQTKIAQAILDGGGDYVLSLKENWPATYAEVAMLFNNPRSVRCSRRNGGRMQRPDRDLPSRRLP